MNAQQEKVIQKSIQTAAHAYFDHCEALVPTFCKRHFCYPGAWENNKHALGWDLLKMPFNLFWAPMYLLSQLLSFAAKRVKLLRLSRWLERVPSGFISKVQKRTQRMVYEELLASPADPEKSALLRSITESIDRNVDGLDSQKEHEQFRHALAPIIGKSLQQYSLTRTASADITNTLLSTAAGAIAFKKFTPGGLGIGIILAGIYTKYAASQDFLLGDTIGGWYYTLFPPSPNTSTLVAATALVLALLAVFSAFSGLLTDPLQYYLGIHQKRLKKMIRHLRQDFENQTESSFHPKDPYIARIMEILDAIKMHV